MHLSRTLCLTPNKSYKSNNSSSVNTVLVSVSINWFWSCELFYPLLVTTLWKTLYKIDMISVSSSQFMSDRLTASSLSMPDRYSSCNFKHIKSIPLFSIKIVAKLSSLVNILMHWSTRNRCWEDAISYYHAALFILFSKIFINS